MGTLSAKLQIVNFAPADVLKEGSHFEPLIACGPQTVMQIAQAGSQGRTIGSRG